MIIDPITACGALVYPPNCFHTNAFQCYNPKAKILNKFFSKIKEKEVLFDFLNKSFPGISKTISNFEAIGYRWNQVSHPFILMRDDQIVSHAGVLEMTLMIEGRQVKTGAIHAVCTHPEYRGKKLGHEVVQSAVSYCKIHYETTIVFTDSTLCKDFPISKTFIIYRNLTPYLHIEKNKIAYLF